MQLLREDVFDVDNYACSEVVVPNGQLDENGQEILVDKYGALLEDRK